MSLESLYAYQQAWETMYYLDDAVYVVLIIALPGLLTQSVLYLNNNNEQQELSQNSYLCIFILVSSYILLINFAYRNLHIFCINMC